MARARIVMWQGGSLWIVDAKPAHQRKTQQTDFHAHHAIQIAVGLGGRFRVSSQEAGFVGAVVAAAADVTHKFEAEGLVGIIFVEPESRIGRAVSQACFAGNAVVSLRDGVTGDLAMRIAQAYQAPIRSDAALASLGAALVARIAGDTPAHAPDLRIRKVVAWAAAHLDAPISLAAAAESCGLSASRLRHLFVEQTGLPFRTYLLWQRLSRGVALLAAGHSLTQAAHEAGFADSAHFSRTFRRMFGVAPTNLKIS